MVGWRSGLVVWVVVCAVAAACGGRSREDDDVEGRAGASRGGDWGGAGVGVPPSEGGVGSRVSDGSAARAGATAAGEPGSEPEVGAGGASGGAPSGETAGAGGVGGEVASLPGDIDENGCVDAVDWVIFSRDYGCSLSSCGDPRADFNHDGWIDDLDYLVFMENWYEGERCRPLCQATGEGGAGGASAEEPTASDLNGDGCIGWADLALLAKSYGCDQSCAAPNTDVVPDGCVDDRDWQVWTKVKGTREWCVGD